MPVAGKVRFTVHIPCLLYVTTLSLLSFVGGRLLPTTCLCADRFPFRPFPAEREGKLYERIAIRHWKDRMPDMSRLCRRIMPSKQLNAGDSSDITRLDAMIAETCVAELVHALLSILGFGCVLIRRSAVGWLIACLYALGNLPYIFIQRYNRPRLVRLRERLARRMGSSCVTCLPNGDNYGNEKGSSSQLQHRSGT